jgi:hypothetical protein
MAVAESEPTTSRVQPVLHLMMRQIIGKYKVYFKANFISTKTGTWYQLFDNKGYIQYCITGFTAQQQNRFKNAFL